MAKGFNKTLLLGRLTSDPELRSTPQGKQVAGFTIAVDRQQSTQKEGEPTTDFFDVTAWEKLAELVSQHLSKGSKVLVEGRLRQDSWEDKDTGKKRSKVVVVANDVTFLDPAGEAKPKDNVPTDIDDKPVDLSEIPF